MLCLSVSVEQATVTEDSLFTHCSAMHYGTQDAILVSQEMEMHMRLLPMTPLTYIMLKHFQSTFMYFLCD